MKLLTVPFLLLATLSSCEKIDVPKGTPSCIKKQIREARSNDHSCHDMVYRYDYKGETVYLFTDDGNCADALTLIYDEDCKLICSMGGINGEGNGQCPDFHQQATNKELIWQE